MNRLGAADRDRVQYLLMGRLDDELSPDEIAEFDSLIETDAGVRAEWEKLRTMKSVTAAVKLRAPPDEIWEDYMNSVYRRIERGAAWILISIGAIVLLSIGLWTGVESLLQDTTTPWYLKGAIMSLLVGFVVLFVSVVREKLFVYKNDPYTEVKR